MTSGQMLSARLHGPGDLRVERVPAPEPRPSELLVEVEACGLCPTDVRKYRVGVNDGSYPFNPGHEWVGTVIGLGSSVHGWTLGDRVYGDTYAGYAELAVLPTRRSEVSCGAFRIPDEMPIERAVFLEPVADCLHALLDSAALGSGDRLLVVGAGQMGLQLVRLADHFGAEVVAIDPLADRRAKALKFGAKAAADPAESREVMHEVWGAEAPQRAIVALGKPEALTATIELVQTGGTIVLFAGFGDRGRTELDLNVIHYRELSIVGATWIGMPPNQRWERYTEALEILEHGIIPTEELVTAYCGLEDIEAHFERLAGHAELKTIVVPREGSLP